MLAFRWLEPRSSLASLAEYDVDPDLVVSLCFLIRGRKNAKTLTGHLEDDIAFEGRRRRSHDPDTDEASISHDASNNRELICR